MHVRVWWGGEGRGGKGGRGRSQGRGGGHPCPAFGFNKPALGFVDACNEPIFIFIVILFSFSSSSSFSFSFSLWTWHWYWYWYCFHFHFHCHCHFHFGLGLGIGIDIRSHRQPHFRMKHRSSSHEPASTVTRLQSRVPRFPFSVYIFFTLLFPFHSLRRRSSIGFILPFLHYFLSLLFLFLILPFPHCALIPECPRPSPVTEQMLCSRNRRFEHGREAQSSDVEEDGKKLERRWKEDGREEEIARCRAL